MKPDLKCPVSSPTEDHRRLQTKERGAVRPAEPQMDQMVAEALLSVLFRPGLSGPEPGLLVRGRRQFGGPETRAQHSAAHQGMRTTPTFMHLCRNQKRGE